MGVIVFMNLASISFGPFSFILLTHYYLLFFVVVAGEYILAHREKHILAKFCNVDRLVALVYYIWVTLASS